MQPVVYLLDERAPATGTCVRLQDVLPQQRDRLLLQDHRRVDAGEPREQHRRRAGREELDQLTRMPSRRWSRLGSPGRRSLDAPYVKVRDGQVINRPFYVVIGVPVDDHRDILGIWAGEGGTGGVTA